jgi:F0F1-type ATP synthase assembly protein I
MGTRAGFFLFVGLIAGAVIGNWLPYPASYETIVGGVVGFLLGFAVDAAARRKRSENK